MPVDKNNLPKLGKAPKKTDPRTLKLARYLHATLPPSPPAVNYAAAITVPLGMMLNDNIGDCAIAAPAHQVMVWTANAKGSPVVPTDAQILAAYSHVSGYNSVTGDNDNGCAMLDVLKYWKKHDIGGHKILGYVEVDPKNVNHVKAAIDFFGGIYLGFALPAATQSQDVWDIPDEGLTGDGEPGSWGGHAVEGSGYGPMAETISPGIAGYDEDGVAVISWGQLIRVTWRYLAAYADEAYAVLSQDWINAEGCCPAGLNLTQLKQDIALVGE